MASSTLSKLSLDAVGIVVLAEVEAVARRTALIGTSSLLDCLILCPGLHRQQDAPKLNSAEYPICAAMTTGYVFRIENQATVAYMQEIGRAGQLTTLTVGPQANAQSLVVKCMRDVYDWKDASVISTLCCLSSASMTVTMTVVLFLLQDWWALLAVGILVCARLVNVLVLRRRAKQGWKGEPEPNAKSDLIVLMSQDRWIRIQGDVDNVKAVTSGEWLREPTFVESTAVAFATLMVYLDVAVAANGSQKGKLLLLVVLFSSAGLLGLANEYTEALKMYGRTVKVATPRKSYRRRLNLAKELIEETGQTKWALKLDMIDKDSLRKSEQKTSEHDGESSQPGRQDNHDEHSEDDPQQYVIKEL